MDGGRLAQLTRILRGLSAGHSSRQRTLSRGIHYAQEEISFEAEGCLCSASQTIYLPKEFSCIPWWEYPHFETQTGFEIEMERKYSGSRRRLIH
jgi:hypothetical protein